MTSNNSETYTQAYTESYTEYEYQVHRVVRSFGSDQEILLKRQSKDVIIVEGSPCEVRGLRDDEIVLLDENPA